MISLWAGVGDVEALDRGDEGVGVRQGDDVNEDDDELDAVALELDDEDVMLLSV